MLSLDKYRNLVRRIDQFASDWQVSPPIPLSCKPGCDHCCRHRFTIFAVEAAAIGQALRGEVSGPPRLDRKAGANGSCPFLDDHYCLIYENRPIICRTQGFPFLYEDKPGMLAPDICMRNRAGEEVSIPARFVLNLENLNRCLASLNYLYLAEMEERGTVVPARLDILKILDETPEMTEA